MALDTVLLAVGANDETRLEELASFTLDVAAPADATVVLAHVFDPDEYGRVRSNLDIDPDSESTPDTVATRHTTIRQLAAALDEAGVEYEVRGAVGKNRGDEIIDLTEATAADLAIVGGRKRSPTGKAVFGSTAQQVIIDAACPVAFVKGGE